LLAVEGPEKWRQLGADILTNALNKEGIGAKTSSGYGRMEANTNKANELFSILKQLAANDIDPAIMQKLPELIDELKQKVPDQSGRWGLIYQYVHDQIQDPEQNVITPWQCYLVHQRKHMRSGKIIINMRINTKIY